jgi:hypothetical protein
VNAAAIPGRVGRRFVHAFREVLPPTLFFLFSFNLIVFTTNLLVHDYWFKVSGFLIATTTALVVGKAVLVANHIRLIDRFRGAPLIQPILYKALFYTLVVLVVRLAERFIHLAIDDQGFAAALDLAVHDFSFHLLPDLRDGDGAEQAPGRGPDVPAVLPPSLEPAPPYAPPARARPDGAKPPRRDDAARAAPRSRDGARPAAGDHRRRPAAAARVRDVLEMSFSFMVLSLARGRGWVRGMRTSLPPHLASPPSGGEEHER